MAELRLPIYSKKSTTDENGNQRFEIEKEYTVDTFFIRLSTLEDILDVVDVDGELTQTRMIALVVKERKKVYVILKDMFPGLTDSELKNVNIPDLVIIVKNIIMYATELMSDTQSEKN